MSFPAEFRISPDHILCEIWKSDVQQQLSSCSICQVQTEHKMLAFRFGLLICLVTFSAGTAAGLATTLSLAILLARCAFSSKKKAASSPKRYQHDLGWGSGVTKDQQGLHSLSKIPIFTSIFSSQPPVCLLTQRKWPLIVKPVPTIV